MSAVQIQNASAMPANGRFKYKKFTVGCTISEFPREVNLEGHMEPKNLRFRNHSQV